MSAFDDMVNQLVAMRFPREVAEAQVRRQRPELAEAIAKSELDDEAREKEVEAEGDRIMLALGFTSIHFSHPGRTKQTPGIADRRYYRRPRIVRCDGADRLIAAITLWWEAKSETGRQRPDQVAFQEMVEACGEAYVLGTHDDLLVWLIRKGICRVEFDGSITSLHAPIVPPLRSSLAALPDIDHPDDDEDHHGSRSPTRSSAVVNRRRDRRA